MTKTIDAARSARRRVPGDRDVMLDAAVVNTAIPHMGTDLHASLGDLKWVIDAYALALPRPF